MKFDGLKRSSSHNRQSPNLSLSLSITPKGKVGQISEGGDIMPLALRASIDDLKMRMRTGQVISALRQLGSTAAIIELIHEDHQGRAIYGCPHYQQLRQFADRYRALYPGDQQPLCLILSVRHIVQSALSGRDLPVYVDVFRACDLDVADEIRFITDSYGWALRGTW